jgi:hypothetical protein
LELGALADDDLDQIALNAINWGRRKIQNVKGGKARWLRKQWSAISVVAGDQFITFDTDLRIISLLWNETEDSEVVYRPEASWRVTDDEGIQLSSDDPGEPTSFTLDVAPDSTTGAKRAEIWPISDGAYSLRPHGYRRLAPIASADLANEIADMPEELHQHIVTLGRLYCIRRLPRAGDLLADANREKRDALLDVASFDLDTTLEQTRIRSAAETQRQAQRIELGFDSTEY